MAKKTRQVRFPHGGQTAQRSNRQDWEKTMLQICRPVLRFLHQRDRFGRKTPKLLHLDLSMRDAYINAMFTTSSLYRS
jgi:hypothetical protein